MRISWEQYFMDISIAVGKRSTCIRRQIGAILVKDNRILATGYNGAPKGQPHCIDIGCLRNGLGIKSGTKHEICRAIHAEQNAIIQAATYGVPIQDSYLFCETFPCSICAKMLINAGIKRVYYCSDYTDPMAQDYFKLSGVECIKL